MTEPSWHYLTATARTAVPRRHVFLSVAGQDAREGGAYARRWAGAAAVYHHAPKGSNAKEFRKYHADQIDLWKTVTGWYKRRSRTVLWCWDLSAALRLSNALALLPQMGWEVHAWSILPQATWLIWRHGDRTLTMVDLQSFFPCDWPTMVASFWRVEDNGLLPPAGTDVMLSLAMHDTLVTRNAVLAYLDWIERERLGEWQLTGTGQGFHAFRHRFLTHKMLVHWDVDARAAERRAMWAGRTEAYWHGTLRRTVVQEWDLEQAYPRIAEQEDVPTELLKTFGPEDDVWRWVDVKGYAVLAECYVSTDLPLVPAEHQGRILWPVGRFATTLWDPELRLLRELGGQVVIHRAWLYRTAPALADWARWIRGRLDDQSRDIPAWQRPIAKHWSRAVIGRLGMQHAAWEYIGAMPEHGMKWWTQVDADSGEVSDLVHVGHQLWESTGTVDWSMSITAVPSWVASRCREIVTRLVVEVGDRKVLYVDTDSVLVQARNSAAVEAYSLRHPELRLRLKRSWRKVTIHGPRQIITGDRVRISGIPVRASLLAGGDLVGEVREGLKAAVVHRRADHVRTSPRRWRVKGIDRRREVGDDGWTVPIRLSA